MNNPYAPPAGEPAAPRQSSPELLALARCHRGVNLAVLGYLTVGILNALPIPAILPGLLSIGIIIYAAIQVFRLGQAIHGPVVGGLSILAILIPFVGLIVLVYLSSQGSKRLRQAGYRVGLLGVSPDQL